MAAEGEAAAEAGLESTDGEREGGVYGDSLSVLSSVAAGRRRLGETERERGRVGRLRRVESDGGMACGRVGNEKRVRGSVGGLCGVWRVWSGRRCAV